MTSMYQVLVLALSGAAVAVAAFAWTVRSGQLDDVDTPARRMLFDDEPASRAHLAADPAPRLSQVLPGDSALAQNLRASPLDPPSRDGTSRGATR